MNTEPSHRALRALARMSASHHEPTVSASIGEPGGGALCSSVDSSSVTADSASTYAAIRTFVTALADAGLRDVCLAPGARSTPLTLCLAAEPRLRCWSHIDERSAAFFALGLARASRRPAAVVCTSGTAAANFFPAIVEARQAHVPLLVLTADRPAELRDCGAFQAIDQLKLFGDQVKWFCEVGESSAGLDYFRSLGLRSVTVAAGAPAGAVHLNFPLREPLTPPHQTSLRSPAPPRHHAAPPRNGSVRVLDEATLSALAATLTAVRRGVIVCGPLDADDTTAAALRALARRCGYPLLADATSGLRDGAHDRRSLITAYDALLRDAETARALTPDLVLRVGPLPIAKSLLLWLRDSGVRQIVIDPSDGWDDPLHRAERVLHADIAPLATALAARLAATPDRTWGAAWHGAEARARAVLDDPPASETLCEDGVVAVLAARLPAGTTLVVGNSMATRDLECFWPGAPRARRVLCNRGANGIDGFVSTALGAAAASDGPTVALTGDLGFLHDLNGLLAARRCGVGAVFVVCNNDGGGIFSYLPQADGSDVFARFFRTTHGLDLRGGVEMYGCRFTRAHDAAALAAALDAGLAHDGCTVIEVPIDLDTSVARHRALWAAAGRAAREGL
jgi:2-succinyl-5-enolpyruvyl-6-hydroxy-3-cyclohexene-1-carboxylate synthase